MPGLQLSFTEEDKAAITERFEQLAEFEPGQTVTMEPHESRVSYFGQQYEGVPLVVDGVFWNSNNLAPVREGGRRDPEHSRYSDEHYVELSGEYDYYQGDVVLLTGVDYSFYKRDGQHVPSLGETGLIAWEEYRDDHDRVHLLSESDNEDHWLEPAEEPCDVCGCNRMKHWTYDDGYNHAGGHECPACGDVKERSGP